MRSHTYFSTSALLALASVFAPLLVSAETIAPTEITTDTSWTLSGSPYILSSRLTIHQGATLTIDPGVVVKLAPDNASMISTLPIIDVFGQIVAGGASTTPEVVFTSLMDDAYGGDSNGDGASTTPETNRWSNIAFQGAGTSTISHARFRYGGGDAADQSAGMINISGYNQTVNGVPVLVGAQVLIEDSVFENVPANVFRMGYQGYLDLERNIFEGAFYLVRFDTSQTDLLPTRLALHENSIEGMRGNAFGHYSGVVFVDASNNWWGSVLGPYDQYNPSANPTGDVLVSSYGMSELIISPFLTCDPATDAVCIYPIVAEPTADSILFIPGTQSSRLYYEDILGVEHQVWEPNFFTDIPYLEMNADGTSKYDLYTKDIIDSIYGNTILERAAIALTNSNIEVYEGLQIYLDSLVASSTLGMQEWRAYPYDWRYGVTEVVTSGTRTKLADGSIASVKLADVIAEMAASSKTGRVTILAHSNGGLVAKALIDSLGANASTTIDRLILVGAPQWGTPKAIGALLHGDNLSEFPSFIVRAPTGRGVQISMPDPYDLLPSTAYFSHVTSPVVTFEPSGSVSGAFAVAYNTLINGFVALKNFLIDTASLATSVGDSSDLRAPAQLRSDLIDAAAARHDTLDSWVPPVGVSVTALAGWGQQTVSGLAYATVSKAVCTSIGILGQACVSAPTLRATPILTQDGDGTVVSPSAIGDTGSAYYFNTKEFSNQGFANILHKNITSGTPVQDVLSQLLRGVSIQTNDFIKNSKPVDGSNPLTVISSHSPLDLVVTDAGGNQTGIVPVSGTDFPVVVQNIPGSSIFTIGSETYIYLPQSGIYDVVATGYGTDASAIEVGTATSEGEITLTQRFGHLPVIPGTLLALTVNGETATTSALTINEDGVGEVEATLEPGNGQALYESPTPAPSPEPAPSSPGSISFPQQVVQAIEAIAGPLVATTSASEAPVASAAPPREEAAPAEPASESPEPVVTASLEDSQEEVEPATADLSQAAAAYGALAPDWWSALLRLLLGLWLLVVQFFLWLKSLL